MRLKEFWDGEFFGQPACIPHAYSVIEHFYLRHAAQVVPVHQRVQQHLPQRRGRVLQFFNTMDTLKTNRLDQKLLFQHFHHITKKLNEVSLANLIKAHIHHAPAEPANLDK